MAQRKIDATDCFGFIGIKMMKYPITKVLNFGAGFYDKWAEHNLNKVYQKLIDLANLNGNEKLLASVVVQEI